MALAFVSSTITAAADSATALPVPFPASIAPGNVLVLLIGTKPFNATITTPGGWMPLGEVTNGSVAAGTDTGSVKMAAFAREAAGDETGTLTVAITSGNSSYGSMYRFTKAAGQGVNFAAAFGVDTTANTSWSVGYTSNPGIISGDHLVLGGVWSTDLARTVTVSSFAATGGTFTGIIAAGDQNPRITTGNDLGGNTNHCACTAGPVSANGTWTATHSVGTNGAGSGVLVRIREIAPGTLTSLAMARHG